jgi:alkaline phosphatase
MAALGAASYVARTKTSFEDEMGYAAFCLTAFSAAQVPAIGSADPIAQIQLEAVQIGFSPIAHWGSDPKRYSQWTTHSNRLVPIYTWGTKSAGKGIDLGDYTGANSPYRSADSLRRIYGGDPKDTLNRDAEFMDQTNIFDIQKAALAAGKRRIILMVFDGTGWETTRAAAIHKSGKVYLEGRGSGLAIQDYRREESQFGLVCTSPHSGDKAKIDVNRQTAVKGDCTGGYDARRAGNAPWAPMPEKEYIKGPEHCKGAHTYTDSSASATSLCAGIKTLNYAVNVLPDGTQVETIARLAQKSGYKTGVVTSVPISHATPAAAYSNNVTRKDYQDLTRDLIGRPSISHPNNPLPGMDVVMGTGWRVDDLTEKEIAAERKNQGENHVPGNRYLTDEDKAAIDVANGGKYVVAERKNGINGRELLKNAAAKAAAGGHRLLAYFGIRGLTDKTLGDGHLPFATANGDFKPTYDRGGKRKEVYSADDINENPTLVDFTETALDLLGKDDGKFWLMVEAGDVDWANHSNNLDNMIGAMYSGDAAFQAICKWVETHGGWNDTVLIVTADHDHYLTLVQPEALVRKDEG